ncbi:MAG TPA: hypothetical protein VNK82_07205 [Terriglobales bacterium]|nr:hypothetical protein [Terriglobales bacterium]
MGPAEAVKAIETVIEQHNCAGDHSALGEIERLLKHVTAETAYVEEKILQLKEAASAFYGENVGPFGRTESQRRHDLVLAVHRMEQAL